MIFCSAESLRCTGCSKTFHFPVRDLFFYSEGEVDLSADNLAHSSSLHPVLKVRAWCIDCNQPTMAERIPSTREFMNAAALARHPDGVWHSIRDELLDVGADELRLLFEKLTTRASRGKCLLCGSRNWLKVDVDDDGTLHPSLIHDACNSPFEWRGWVGGIVGRLTVRVYSFDGNLMAQRDAVG